MKISDIKFDDSVPEDKRKSISFLLIRGEEVGIPVKSYRCRDDEGNMVTFLVERNDEIFVRKEEK